METFEILRYKRASDCWICPDCDCENPAGLHICEVCGQEKPSDAIILSAYREPVVIPKSEIPPLQQTVLPPTVKYEVPPPPMIPEPKEESDIVAQIFKILTVGLLIILAIIIINVVGGN